MTKKQPAPQKQSAFTQRISVWVNENGTSLFFKAVLWIIGTLLAITCYFLTGYFQKAEKATDKMETFSESVNQFSQAVTELKFVVQDVKKDNGRQDEEIAELRGMIKENRNDIKEIKAWRIVHEQERTQFFQEYDLRKRK